MGKINDLGFVLEYHSQLNPCWSERCRLLWPEKRDVSWYRCTKSSQFL